MGNAAARGHRAAVTTAVLVAATATAQADRTFKAEAERRNRLASQLYQEGRYDSALQMYQSAHDLHPDPKFLFNIALAKEKTFDFEGCAIVFAEFLDKAGSSASAEARDTATARGAKCLERTAIAVRITSVPTNAAIHLREGDGRALRGRTPQELKLAPGDHELTVELEGHVPQTQVIAVRIGDRPQADFVLEKLSSLRIEVDPSGARVAIDEADWQAAPLAMQLKAGVHRVAVEKPGYESARREVRVESGQEVSLVLSLRPLAARRTLRIAADGGTVSVDGRSLGPAPARVELAPGTHRVRVAAPGRIPYADSIVVPETSDVRLAVSLTPVRTRRNRIVFWSLAGAAGAAAAVGTIYGVQALSDHLGFADAPGEDASERGELRAERADLWFGTAVALGASALGFHFFTRPSPSTATLE